MLTKFEVISQLICSVRYYKVTENVDWADHVQDKKTAVVCAVWLKQRFLPPVVVDQSLFWPTGCLSIVVTMYHQTLVDVDTNEYIIYCHCIHCWYSIPLAIDRIIGLLLILVTVTGQIPRWSTHEWLSRWRIQSLPPCIHRGNSWFRFTAIKVTYSVRFFLAAIYTRIVFLYLPCCDKVIIILFASASLLVQRSGDIQTSKVVIFEI